MRPPKQKQPQVKKGLCRVLEHIDIDGSLPSRARRIVHKGFVTRSCDSRGGGTRDKAQRVSTVGGYENGDKIQFFYFLNH